MTTDITEDGPRGPSSLHSRSTLRKAIVNGFRQPHCIGKLLGPTHQ